MTCRKVTSAYVLSYSLELFLPLYSTILYNMQYNFIQYNENAILNANSQICLIL